MPRYRPKEAQSVRCIALLVAMVQAKRGVQLRPFYARREWNTRCSYRDLHVLRAAGVPIEEPERGWYRVPSSWLPASTLNITRDEASALAIAASLPSALRETAIGRALHELRSKMGAAPVQATLDLEPAPLRTRTFAAIDYRPHRATIDAVFTAIERRLAIRVDYRDARGLRSARTIEPGFVHYEPSTEALYVFAWCRQRAAVRTFAMQRIERCELSDERCTPRPEVAAEWMNALRVWSRPGTQHVVLQFSAAVAVEVRERQWHASQQLRDLQDGGLELELDIAAPEELERTLLGYADDVHVVAPESLALRLRERHAAAIRVPRLPMLHARRSQDRVPQNAAGDESADVGRPTRVTG